MPKLTKGRLAKEAFQKPFGVHIYKLGYDEVNWKERRACLGNHDLTIYLDNTSLLSKTLDVSTNDTWSKGGGEGEKLLPQVW